MAKTTGSPSAARGFQPSLGTRFFVATALIVVVAMVAAVTVTAFFGRQIAFEAVRQDLQRSYLVLESFQAKNLDQLRWVGRLFAQEPQFAAYVKRALEEQDPFSMADQLEERQGDLEYDLAIVLDPDGRVFVRTDGAPRRADEDLSAEPLVVEAFEYFEAAGPWVSHGTLFYAAAVPIVSGGILEGFLIAGNRIDGDAALELRRISGTEVVFLVRSERGPRFAASTLDERRSEELERQLESNPQLLATMTEDDVPREVVLDGRRYLTLVLPLAGVSDEAMGNVVSLASLEDQLEPYRRIQRTLMGVGLAAVLVALGISYLLPRRVLRPVRQLAAAAKAAAAGDFDQRIAPQRADEVGQLAEAFDVLLSELREKRDMELYISELAKNVPEEEASAVDRPVPATSKEMALLGVDLPGLTEQLAVSSPRETIDRLGQGVRFVTQAISNHGGKVQSLVGYRLLASFRGSRRAERALSAGAEIVAGGSGWLGKGDASPLVAVAGGNLVTGSVVWENRPENAIAGRPVDELESLLKRVQPGSVWLSAPIYEELRELLDESRIETRNFQNPESGTPIYALDAEAASRLSHPDLTATQDLTVTAGATVGAAMTTLSAIGPGSQLGERFKILSELGAGGMGVVYKARDYSLNELVALKMLKGKLWEEADRLDQLKDELKLARRISHPNVLRTFDFGEMAGVPFISMEYVRGITLRRLLDQSGRLPLSAGLRLARQLCRGLTAAHDEGVLHRDIKPENLIVEHTGNVKLMDFGIAQRIQRGAAAQTEEGAVLMGTPYYLSPEQLGGKEADERADIYAVGVVLYEIFTGKLPYPPTRNVMQIITIKVKKPPIPPREHWPGMPEELERILLHCLERQPEDRYSDVRTLLDDLELLRA